MGLIKAITGAAGGVLADQWKEFFYCDSIANDILIVKGQKHISGRSSNTKAEDNIISNGSGIAVADGQCMIIVEQGKVVELCAEPGQFTWNSSTEPSIFAGSLGESILETFKAIGKRFTYGGDTGKDQRVYYFNTKEILDNKFGTANPIAFRVVDSRINFDVDVSLRCNGTYTFRITDPIKLYTNVTGNVAQSYSKDELRDTMKTEFVSALGPALAKLSMLEIRPNQIPAHTNEFETYLNEELSAEWGARGIGDVKGGDQSADAHRRRSGNAQDRAENCHVPRSHDGGSYAGRRSGGCHEDRSRQLCRRDDRLHGHGHGDERRRHECTESLCNGSTATGSTGVGRSSCSGRLEMLLRCGCCRKVLSRMRGEEARTQACGWLDVQMRCDGNRKILPRMRFTQACR